MLLPATWQGQVQDEGRQKVKREHNGIEQFLFILLRATRQGQVQDEGMLQDKGRFKLQVRATKEKLR